jgi:hypothetical protein
MSVAIGSQLFDGCTVFIVVDRAVLLGRLSRQNRRAVRQHEGFLSFESRLTSQRTHVESDPAPDGLPEEPSLQWG